MAAQDREPLDHGVNALRVEVHEHVERLGKPTIRRGGTARRTVFRSAFSVHIVAWFARIGLICSLSINSSFAVARKGPPRRAVDVPAHRAAATRAAKAVAGPPIGGRPWCPVDRDVIDVPGRQAAFA